MVAGLISRLAFIGPGFELLLELLSYLISCNSYVGGGSSLVLLVFCDWSDFSLLLFLLVFSIGGNKCSYNF